MSLKSKLLKGPGPEWENSTCEYVCASFTRFSEVMECFYSGDFHLSHRATLIILKVGQHKPQWLKRQLPKLVDSLDQELPDWYKRNILRILQDQVIPESHWGHAADQCFKYLASSGEPVAVKVFSMSVLYGLTKELPELAAELRFLIEEQFPLGSAGFKARGRRVLNHLEKDGH